MMSQGFYNQTTAFIIDKKEKICLIIALISAIFLIFSLFQISVLLAFAVFASSILGFVYFRWKELHRVGIINKLSPKMKNTLLHRSIFDIYRDVIYFPYVTKIVGAFVKGAISKPPPEQLPLLFETLPQNVRDAIYTKGLLHLAPGKVQEMILAQQEPMQTNTQVAVIEKPKIPQERIHREISHQWDNLKRYQEQVELKAHEQTFGRQMLTNLNNQFKWRHIAGLAALLGYALMKTRSKKMAKIFLYNGSFAGILLLLVLILVKIKKPETGRSHLPLQIQFHQE